MSEAHDAKADIEAALLDWLEFQPQSSTKIVARRRETQRLDAYSINAMRIARVLQDRGLISILTRRRGREILFIAERAI